MNWKILIATFLFASCNSKKSADLLVINGTIYTVDSTFSTAEAMAIKDGKVLETGTSAALQQAYDAKEVVDAKGKFIYPGFIDAHAHFVGYATTLQTVDLTGTSSWSECLQRIRDFVARNPVAEGDWIQGRGWDQNDWEVKEYPANDSLDVLFKDVPILLTRVDGHAAIASNKALELAGVNAQTRLTGGDVEVKNGKPTGILIDNAVDLVAVKIPPVSKERLAAALKEAEKNCFAKGLTTLDDCGLEHKVVTAIDSLQKAGQLKMRIYAMLSDIPSNYQFINEKGKIKTDRLNVRAMKVYVDGALGSRGACLLNPYHDRPGHYGFLLSKKEHYDSAAAFLSAKDFQMCTHAIGDSGNRVVLNTYGKYLQPGNDKRWRIEHAQVINANDFARFKEFNVVPSVQPTHATSDMYWAGQRLGREREKGAYAYKQLMQQNGWIPLGTDFPVEDIDPLKTFLAAVFRKDAKGWPGQGYQMENALTREETIRGMTIWAAKSNFEEQEKGSLEKGKFADFIILDKDLMKVGEKEVLGVKVLSTYLNGEKTYDNN
jgi:predicted amidohydrolase YtcJ